MNPHPDLAAVLASLPATPPTPKYGRGYLTMVSDPNYAAGAFVLAGMLRHVRAEDPLHVWYWFGDAHTSSLLDAAPNVRLHCLDDIDAPRGGALRSHLMLHCGLNQAFWIGADAYPVADPTYVLDDAARFGSVFWWEVPAGDKFVPANYGLDESAKNATYQVQGDTIALDLTDLRVYRALALTHWCNGRAELNRSGEAFGDQTQFRAAWALCGLDQPCYDLRPVDWESVPFVYLHRGRDGNPLIVHRLGSKWMAGGVDHHALTFDVRLPLEEVAHVLYRQCEPWGCSWQRLRDGRFA